MRTATAGTAAADVGKGHGATAVEITAITKSFGTVQALREVGLTVETGSVYGVLGPNGAGKTTLLRILLGLVRPDSGSVTVLGDQPGAPAALRRTGALVESPAFVPYLSGRQNLRVLARARGLPDAEVRRVLEIVELDHRADERYTGYSLGMGQRLGVAAALLGSPSLLILDEPTNGLDPDGVASMRRFIRGLGEDGITVLLSSHLLGEVQQICDRVVVLNEGSVIAEDSVSALRERTGVTIVDVWASPAERVSDVLRSVSGGNEATRVDTDDDPHWRLEMSPDAVPVLIRTMVEAGLEVQEVRRERPTLEDAFFSLTRDEPASGEQR